MTDQATRDEVEVMQRGSLFPNVLLYLGRIELHCEEHEE